MSTLEQPILLQDVNGGCPLLAVANFLLLRGSRRLLTGESIRDEFVRNHDLIERLSSCISSISTTLLRKNPTLSAVTVNSITQGVSINIFFLVCLVVDNNF